MKISFNTSYVSVQVGRYTISAISILSFNTSYVSVQVMYCCYYHLFISLFQYILCVGSR